MRRKFQGYTTDRADVLLGICASAISQLAEGYVQNDSGARGYAARIAAGNLATVKGYALTNDDRLRRGDLERIVSSSAWMSAGSVTRTARLQKRSCKRRRACATLSRMALPCLTAHHVCRRGCALPGPQRRSRL